MNTLIIIVSVMLLGVMDYSMGYNLNFFVIYFLPIAFVASHYKARAAYGISLFCAVIWYISDLLSGHLYPAPWMGVWNAVIRFIAFAFVSYTITKISSLLAASMKEVKTLQSFLSICARCKKIRDDQGNWKQLEAYISEHTDTKFSHGYCKNCMEDAMSDIENYRKQKDMQSPKT